jgi:hypothetical protein
MPGTYEHAFYARAGDWGLSRRLCFVWRGVASELFCIGARGAGAVRYRGKSARMETKNVSCSGIPWESQHEKSREARAGEWVRLASCPRSHDVQS